MGTTGPEAPTEWGMLLDAARDGDDVALGEICDRLYQYLLMVANRGIGADLRTKVGASDVVQDSMLEAHRAFPEFTGSSEQEFRAWTVRLLRRNMVDAARRYRGAARRDLRREILPDSGLVRIPSHDDNASRIARNRETDEELAKAIDELPDRQRLVVVMRHRDYLPYDQIAIRLSTTEQAARRLYSRAVQSLRERLVPGHGEQA